MEGTLQRAVCKSPVSKAAHSACNQLSGGHCPPPGKDPTWGQHSAAALGLLLVATSQPTHTLFFSFCCLKIAGLAALPGYLGTVSGLAAADWHL